MATRLVFPEKQKVELEEFQIPEVQDDQVLVESACSLMSTGTENIVFNQIFEEGTHWHSWVKFPFYPGYATVGVVKEASHGVRGVSVGDKVALRGTHSSHHVVDAGQCYGVSRGLQADQASWFALAKITFMGARAANYGLGDKLLVIGAGPIGQMSIRWAYSQGVECIIAIDLVQDRLEFAKKGGATHTICGGLDNIEAELREICDGDLPNIVMDSTGNATVFQRALGLCAQYGRIVLIGDTGTPTEQRLTHEVVIKGLTIVGAHDSHDDEKWTNGRIHEFFINLIESGRFRLDGLITHRFKPTQCVDAYQTANQRRGETMGILFEWN